MPLYSFSEEVCLDLINYFMGACLNHDLHVQVYPRDPGLLKSYKTVFRAVARVEPWLVHKAETADSTSEWLSIVLSVPGTSKLL